MLPNDKQKNPLSVILVVDHLDKATDFYHRTFGALEQERYADSGGKVWYAVINVLGTSIQLMEPFAEMGYTTATEANVRAHGDQITLNAHIEDTAGVYARGLKAKASAMAAPSRTDWGTHTATFRDPFGHRWNLGSSLSARDAAVAPVAVSVTAGDVARAVTFFTHVFGASKPVAHQDRSLTASEYQVVHIGGAPLQIVKASPSRGLKAASPTRRRPGGDVSILTVAYSDVDGASQRAIAAGGTSVVDPQDAYWGDRYAEVATTEGTRVAACSEDNSPTAAVTAADAQESFRAFLETNDNPTSPAEAVGVRNVSAG